MTPKKHYALDDFQGFALASFPLEYGSVVDSSVWYFESSVTVDEQLQAQERTLLCIGRYYHSETSKMMAWAHATTSGVTYYSGKSGQVCKPIPTTLQARIYHDHPFDTMFNLDRNNWSDRGGGLAHMTKELVIEAFINFAFLFTGRLRRVDNVHGADMLSSFRFACINYHKNKDARAIPEASLIKPPTVAISPRILPTGCTLSDPIANENSRRVRNTPIPIPRILKQSPHIKAKGNDTGPTPQHQTKNTSFAKHQTAYEATLRAQYDEKVRALEHKLNTQKLKTSAAKEKLRRERKQRQATDAKLLEFEGQLRESGSQREYQMTELSRMQRKQDVYRAQAAELSAKFMVLHTRCISSSKRATKGRFGKHLKRGLELIEELKKD